MHDPEATGLAGPGGVPRGHALHEAVLRLRAGDIVGALADLTVLADADAGSADPVDAAILLASLTDCRLARGDLADAMALGDELTAYLELDGVAGAVAHHAKGELSAVLGDPEQAIAHFASAGQFLASAAGCPVELVPWRAAAAVALVRAGRNREAADLAVEWLEVATTAGSAYARAHALRTAATVCPGGDRVAQLREARATLGATVANRLAAQIDTDLAGLLILTGAADDQQEARVLLRAAEGYAGHQELWPLQGRVRRLLDRLGEAPQRVHGEALAVLTAAERRIARLAADGLTNRQIAEALAVTIKAVEWHLSHVYRKLGIDSRTRLAGTLGVAV